MSNIVSTINKDAKIAVLAGGMSSEKDVSMRSGKGCLDALQRLGYKNSELVYRQSYLNCPHGILFPPIPHHKFPQIPFWHY